MYEPVYSGHPYITTIKLVFWVCVVAVNRSYYTIQYRKVDLYNSLVDIGKTASRVEGVGERV